MRVGEHRSRFFQIIKLDRALDYLGYGNRGGKNLFPPLPLDNRSGEETLKEALKLFRQSPSAGA